MTRTVAILAMVMGGSAAADEGPSFDCAAAETAAETLVCESPELARLDRLVAARYEAALAAVAGLDVGSGEAEEELRATQRGWIAGRDECWKADDPNACVAEAYQRREGQLVARWLLDEPRGLAVWACDGSPANEVVTTFFDTTVPSVRFERGDAVDTGTMVPTASGSKYEGSFGRSIWIKGEEATYRDPDPDGITVTCTLARDQ